MTMTQAEVNKVIQRYSDGSINIDFYRARIGAQRPQAMQDGLKSKGTLASGLVTAAALGLVAILASASWQGVADSAPQIGAVQERTGVLAIADSHRWWSAYGKGVNLRYALNDGSSVSRAK